MTLEAAAALVRRGKRFLVTCHVRPDSDALGSALGLGAMLRALGKDVVVYCDGGTPAHLRWLDGSDRVVSIVPEGTFDATFVMDTAAVSLLPALPGTRKGPLVVVDHHAVHDDFGELELRHVDASSTGEVVMRLWAALGDGPLPPGAAQPIYAAIVADTGGFRYPGTHAATMRLGARLLDEGVDPWTVASNLFERWPRERMALLGEIVTRLEHHAGGRLALVCVDRAMFDRTGATDEMLEGMVNYGRMLEGVCVAALLWTPRGRAETKVSFRGNAGTDVAVLARLLGGGGHTSAAATTLSASVADTRQTVIAAVERFLAGA